MVGLLVSWAQKKTVQAVALSSQIIEPDVEPTPVLNCYLCWCLAGQGFCLDVERVDGAGHRVNALPQPVGLSNLGLGNRKKIRIPLLYVVIACDTCTRLVRLYNGAYNNQYLIPWWKLRAFPKGCFLLKLLWTLFTFALYLYLLLLALKTYVRLWLVCWLVRRSVCYNFLERQESYTSMLLSEYFWCS